ncbi:TlpA disulfide reductase family protein [Accumulibacter sp.]|uniref:TlpA family protein disulfide reductase n=1 Tax=Accumulibacter sp. TaxID=2053492 RepID=UPI002601B2CE|nr:TlpA disulfide reductase family protein [Accumulibacter sp.]
MKSLFVVLLLLAPALLKAVDDPPSTAALFALTLNTADGRAFALASLKGQPLVINFWARWCLPCRREIPDLTAVHAEYQGRGLVVVGIAVEEEGKRDGVRDFARAYDLNYLSLIGGLETSVHLMQALGNGKSGLPFSVVIDRRGTIRSSKLGAMSRPEMRAAIEAVL